MTRGGSSARKGRCGEGSASSGSALRGSTFDTVYYQVTLSTGEVLVPEGQAELPPADPDVAAGTVILTDDHVDDVHVRMATVQSDLLGIVQIARPLTEVDATLAGLAAALFVFGAVGVLLAAGAGLLIARSALKPIDEFAEAAEHVAETQDLGARIDIVSNDEVGRLAAEFNAMLAAFNERTEQQRLGCTTPATSSNSADRASDQHRITRSNPRTHRRAAI